VRGGTRARAPAALSRGGCVTVPTSVLLLRSGQAPGPRKRTAAPGGEKYHPLRAAVKKGGWRVFRPSVSGWSVVEGFGIRSVATISVLPFMHRQIWQNAYGGDLPPM